MMFLRRPVFVPVAIAALLAASGCGRKEAPAPAPPQAAAPAVPAAAPLADAPKSSEAPARPSAPAGDPLTVGFAYAGPVGDGGWNFAQDRGRREMDAALGPRTRTVAVANVPDGPEGERALRDLVAQGGSLIFGTAVRFGEAMARLALEFPAVKWEVAGATSVGENLRGYDVRSYQATYLAGVVAGRTTKTDILGFVASFPVPAVVRDINAFTLGAQSVNPSVRTKVAWVNSALDPVRESEAAQSLINGGADVLLQSTGSAAPLQVAERAGKHGIGWSRDMQAHAPKAHLASVVLDWGPYFAKAAAQVLDGTWAARSSWLGLRDGAVDLVSLADAVPPDLRALIEERKQAIMAGSLRIWRGPMLDSEDREVLHTGVVGSDFFVRDMMFYVKGVEGSIPAPR